MADKIAVLVVEDEILVRMTIASTLEDNGYEVFEAGNADEAIILLETHASIRLMFTDIDMPGSIDGLKLARAVRDRWPPVRIVVTSGNHVIDVADLPEGSRFFGKPYRGSAIISSFKELLAGA